MISELYTGHVFTAQSATLPVELEDARTHLKMDDNVDDDTYIELLIKSQCEYVERQYCAALLEKTVVETHLGFPQNCGPIWLAVMPVSAVTSVTYIDVDGTQQTLASSNYSLVKSQSGACIALKATGEYPTDVAIIYNAVTITYTAGFGTTAADIPENVRLGILARIGRAYTEREDSPEFKMSMSDILLSSLKRYL